MHTQYIIIIYLRYIIINQTGGKIEIYSMPPRDVVVKSSPSSCNLHNEIPNAMNCTAQQVHKELGSILSKALHTRDIISPLSRGSHAGNI